MAGEGSPTVLRRGGWGSWGLVGLAMMVALVALLILAIALFARGGSFGLSLFLGGIALFNLGMAWILLGEAMSRLSTRVEIDGDRARLRLPARRGYVPNAPYRGEIALTDIAAIECRPEAFRAMRSTVIQQAYGLAMKDGARIFLGADRRLTDVYFGRAADALARRAGLTIADKGMVDGKPGVILLFGQSVPDWMAPSLAPDLEAKRWREEEHAYDLLWLILGISSLVVALTNLL